MWEAYCIKVVKIFYNHHKLTNEATVPLSPVCIIQGSSLSSTLYRWALIGRDKAQGRHLAHWHGLRSLVHLHVDRRVENWALR